MGLLAWERERESDVLGPVGSLVTYSQACVFVNVNVSMPMPWYECARSTLAIGPHLPPSL